MLAKRLIPCRDVKEGRVVKSICFVSLEDAGDPVEQARLYDAAGADELVFLDISATPEGRATVAPTVRRVADEAFYFYIKSLRSQPRSVCGLHLGVFGRCKAQ